MKNFLIIIIFTILLASLGGADTKAGEQNRNNSSLISRDLLFGNPDRITTRISPDGSNISFLAPKDGSAQYLGGAGRFARDGKACDQ